MEGMPILHAQGKDRVLALATDRCIRVRNSNWIHANDDFFKHLARRRIAEMFDGGLRKLPVVPILLGFCQMMDDGVETLERRVGQTRHVDVVHHPVDKFIAKHFFFWKEGKRSIVTATTPHPFLYYLASVCNFFGLCFRGIFYYHEGRMRKLLLFAVVLLATAGTAYAQLNCSIAYTTYVQQCTGCVYNPAAPFNLPFPYNNFTQSIAALEAEIIQLQQWLAGNISQCAAVTSQQLQTQTVAQQIYTSAELMLSPSRLLNNLWLGPLVRLQLPNGTQQDFNPVNGILNVTAVLLFANNGTAYVTTLYDQSGNNLHYRQQTLSLMPIIAQNGYVIQQGGHPALLFNSTATASMNIPSWNTGSVSSNVAVQGSLIGPPVSAVAASILVNPFGNSSNFAGILGRFGWNGGLVIFNPPTQVALVENDVVSTTNSLYINNGAPDISVAPVSNVAYGTLSSIYWTTPVGAWVDTLGSFFSQNGAIPFLGIVSEVILWSNQPSSVDQNAVYANQQQFYNLALGIVPQLSTAPTLALSVRQLNYAYVTPCMNVRRSSDNTIQAIGFNATGDLDVVGLLAFVGSGNGFVQTWFDQSGNGNNAIQTNNSNQPIIVNSGVLNTDNGKPAIAFNAGSLNYLLVPTYFNNGSIVYGSIVTDLLANTAQGHLVSIASGANDSAAHNFVLFYQAGTELGNLYGPIGTVGVRAPVGRLQYALSSLDGVNQNLAFDGSFISSLANSNSLTVNRLAIGGSATNSVANFVTANVDEVIVWNSAPTYWDLQLVQTSQSEYYGVGALPVVESLDVFANTTETGLGLGSNYCAFSVRLVVNSYLGKCLNIRRSSDGISQDIGFTTHGNLDTVALLAFVGNNNNGTITVWYDQSGNSFNAVQTNVSHQPVLVQNGVLLTTYTGRPAPTFYASAAMYLQVIGFSDTTVNIFGEAVVSVTGNAPAGARIISASLGTTTPDTTGNLDMAVLYYGGSGAFNTTRNNVTATISGNNYFLNAVSSFVNNGSLQLASNGQQVPPATTPSTVFGISTVWLGGGIGVNNQFLDGQLAEVFLSSIVPTAFAQDQIFQRQQKHFGTYSPPLSLRLASAPQQDYGLRLVINSYTGPLLNVQRSSDSTALDIFPDPQTGWLNTTALMNFVGTGTGYVASWYDQSGHGITVSQGSQANMPRIVVAGILQTQNNQPCIKFISSANTNLLSQNYPNIDQFFAFQVVASTTANDNSVGIVSITGAGIGNLNLEVTNDGTTIQGFIFTGTPTITVGVLHTFQAYITGSTSDMIVDGVHNVGSSGSPYNAAEPQLNIGSNNAGASPFDGFICEVHIGTPPTNTDLSTLLYNTRVAWGTP